MKKRRIKWLKKKGKTEKLLMLKSAGCVFNYDINDSFIVLSLSLSVSYIGAKFMMGKIL